MKNYNKFLRAACLLTVAAAFSSCSKENGGGVVANESAQTITLAVANTGDNFLATRTSRPLYSSEAAQNIEKVKVVIYYLGPLPQGVTTNEGLTDQVMQSFTLYGQKTIVAQKLFSNWMNNGVSSAYNNSTYGNGRQASWTLSTTDQITTEGVYMAYAVGYNDSDYTSYTSFASLAKQNSFTFPLTVAQNTVSGSEVAPKVHEVFAGSAPFVVTKKEVAQGTQVYSYQFNVSLTLHRQVAGTIGYFTNIPVKGNADHADKDGAKLRLVSSTRSANAAFAAFNSEYTSAPGDATANVKYVVNGYGEATRANSDNAKFYGSATNDAYTVYEVELSDWFKGYSKDNTTIGMDINGDGMLNEADTAYNETATWVNPFDAENKKPGVKKGTVLGSSFLFPFVMNSSKPTFQLQMLDKDGEIIRYWNIRLQTSTSTDSQINQYASLVGENGSATRNSEAETYVNYSVLRNHLYNIGTRNAGDGGTDGDDDKAQPLNNETLILRVNDNWEMIHEMEID